MTNYSSSDPWLSTSVNNWHALSCTGWSHWVTSFESYGSTVGRCVALETTSFFPWSTRSLAAPVVCLCASFLPGDMTPVSIILDSQWCSCMFGHYDYSTACIPWQGPLSFQLHSRQLLLFDPLHPAECWALCGALSMLFFVVAAR